MTRKMMQESHDNKLDEEAAELTVDSQPVAEAPKKKEVPDGGYGWVIVFGSTFTHFLVVGLGRSFGVFFLILQNKFGESAFATSSVIAIHNTVRQVLGPVTGLLVDRFSCRTVVMIGGVLMLIGCVISAFATSIIYLYISFGVIAGLGGSFIFTPSYVIVGQYFDKKKGKAMGMSTIGTGLGSVALAPLLAFLLGYYGYSGAMLITGALMLNNCIAGALFRPLVTETKKSDEQNTQKVPLLQSISRAFVVLKNVTFIMYCLQITSMSICVQTFVTFLPVIAEQYGTEAEKAAFLLSIVGIVDMISRFVWGFFFDLKSVRYRRRLFHALLGLPMCAFAIITGFMTTYAGFAAMAVLFSLFEGGFHSQRATIVSEFVSKDQMSSTVGFVIFFQGVGNMLGPPVAGALRDMRGNYDVCFFFSGAAIGLTCSLFLLNYMCHACLRKHNVPPAHTPTSKT